MQLSEELFESIAFFFNKEWFHIGETVISFSTIVGFILIFVFVNWLAKVAEKVIYSLATKRANTSVSTSSIYALSRISRYIILFIGTIVGLNFIGFDLSSLAILGGALGVGIGFGLQNIFNNLVSGIIILLEETLKVGDFVDLESGVMGRVSEINMRYTRITTNDQVDIIVPNSEFINGRVINWTLGDLHRRMHIPFGVAYGTDKELVKQCALTAAKSVSYTIEDKQKETDVWLTNFGDNSLDFELVVWVGAEGVRAPSKVHAKFLWAIETELGKAGIEIPFPQRDLHVKSGALNVNLIK
ncbi:MAG: mechanosensitive ion channel [Betaproteobacteria bacterium]|nr:mechanosensitive ion channel [Betaproteobacteria bacterium]